MVLGLMTWLTLEVVAPDAVWPPQFVGFIVSAIAMLVFSLLPQYVGTPTMLAGHSGPAGYHPAAGHGTAAVQEHAHHATPHHSAARPQHPQP
jgi:hypothetical protein